MLLKTQSKSVKTVVGISTACLHLFYFAHSLQIERVARLWPGTLNPAFKHTELPAFLPPDGRLFEERLGDT